MRSEYELRQAMGRHADMIQRICLCHLKNRADTEDMFQIVLLKYLQYDGIFEDSQHEKAWFIRVTLNACKDHLKRIFRRREQPLELLTELAPQLAPEEFDTLEAVLSLPEKYRNAIYLHYYEGYSAVEIAGLMQLKPGAVYSLLSRGRAMLRKRLGGDGHEG